MKMTMLFAGVVAGAAVFGQAISFDIAADRADCEYRCGEAATFTVKAVGEDGGAVTSGVVSAGVDNFGPQVQLRRQIDLSQANPFTLKGRMDEPGFLRVRLGGKDCRDQSFGVAYEPTKIEQGSPSPADFDAFWAAARARLAREVPLDAQVLRVSERCTKDFDFFRISLATFGRRVYGYMSVPTARRSPTSILTAAV